MAKQDFVLFFRRISKSITHSLKHLLIVLSLMVFFSTMGYSQVTLTTNVDQQPTCADPLGGEITATVSGGIDPYTVFIVSIPPGYSESIVGAPGQTVFNFPDPSHPPLGEGTYLITATDSDTPFNFDSENVFLSISQPVVTVPPTPVEICDNAAVDNILTRVSAAPGGGTFTFTGTGVSGNSFDPDGLSGTVNIGVQYDLGSCTVNETFAYDVNPSPTPTIAGPGSVCEGASGIVYTTEAGQSNYAWTVSGGGNITSGGGATDNSVTVTWTTAGARTVSVNYENADGCSATSPTVLNVTVNPLPVPTIAGLASVCDGDTESYSTEAGNTNYNWVIVGGAISSGGGLNDSFVDVTWNTTGAQSVSVNYQDPNGCTAAAPTVYPVTVNSLPAPTITGPLVVCETTAGNIYSTEAGQSNYNWLISAGGTITAGGTGSDNTVTVTWNTPGPQTVSVNYLNAAGCTALAPTVENITVNARPTPTLAGSADECEGSTGNVYTTEAGQSNYVWVVSAGGSITAGGTGTDNTVTVSWTTAGPQTVSVNYDNAANCDAVSPTVLNVTVNALPVPVISGPATACDGSTGNVYSTEAGNSNYIWNVVGGVVSSGGGVGDNSVTVTWNTVGPQSVSVEYTDTNNCTPAAPTVYPVTVNALPAPTITGATTVCEGAIETYTTEAGQSNYNWTVSAGGTITNGGSATDAFVEVEWTSAAPQTVTVNYQNAGGCTAALPVVENITVNPLPNPTIAGANDICEGATGNVYTTEAGQSNYVWAVTGGNITNGGTATDDFVEITWTTAGAQSVSVNYDDANTCSAATPTSFAVNVNSLPVVTLAGPLSACEASTGNTYTTETGQTNYSWIVSAGGTITSGGTATDDFVEVTWNGSGGQSVSVNYEDANGCTAALPTTINVAVDALPSSMTMTGPAGAVCEGETADIDLQITGGTGPFEVDISYGSNMETLAIPDNNLFSHESLPLTDIPTTTFSITEVRDLGTNCVMDPSNHAADVVVNVNQAPSVLALTLPIACISSTTFEVSGFIGGSASTANWAVVANGVPGNLGPTTPGILPNQFVATYTMDPGDVNTSITFEMTTDDPDGAGGCTAASDQAVVFVSDVAPSTGPAISGDTDVCTSSTSVTYTATSVPNGVLYVWNAGAATIVSGQGTTSIELDFSTAPANTINQISVFAQNGCGDGPTTTFDVQVNEGPAITSQPVATAVCEGDDATYSVVATGNVTYQWELDDGSGFSAIAGEVSPNLTVTTTLADNGNMYRVVVGAAGCPSVTSDEVALTVNSPTSITTQPASQTVCMDDNVTLSVVATGTPSYQWEESTDGGANFNAMTGETNADLQINNISLTADGNQYRVIVMTGGCPDVTSAIATITVEDCTPPDCSAFTVRVDNPVNASCGGADGSFTLVPENGVEPYLIEVDKNDGSGFVQSAADVTGLGPGTYDYRVTDDQGCQFTGSVIIGEKQLVADFTNVVDAICNGDNGSVMITVTSGGGNYEYSFDNQTTWTAFISGANVPVPPGSDYTILVRDNTGEYCSTASGLITIGESSAITFSIGLITESVPERASGSIEFLSISGGVPPYQMDVALITPTAPDQYQPQLVDRIGIPVPIDPVDGTSSILIDDLYAGFYQIFITDANGCEIEVLTTTGDMVEVPMDNNLFIPNVFTPNGDGVNDVFFIRNMPEDAPTSVLITNRWGKAVYQNSDYQNDWDANGLSDGVYYYTINLDRESVKGWVEVWRGTR